MLGCVIITTGLTKFTFRELEATTHQFSKENIIGDGASAVVYKGALRDGLAVAVKKFKASVGFSLGHFYEEFNLVPKLEHKNIIKLQGYCHQVAVDVQWLGDKYVGVEERHCLFVEEYVPNGSLDKIISGESQLSWSSRMEIVLGIAHGLHYLHEQHVVHSDLKPVNILLDTDMNPKISDFGIARILDHSDDMTIRDDNYLAGTVGYMPPDYIIQGILSTKYDVYSFGVILLEIISGMCRPVPARRQAAVEWAWEVRQAVAEEDLFDRHKEIKTYMEVGLLCTQINRKDRPTMADVLVMLDGKNELPTPKKPRYTKRSADLPTTIGMSSVTVNSSRSRTISSIATPVRRMSEPLRGSRDATPLHFTAIRRPRSPLGLDSKVAAQRQAASATSATFQAGAGPRNTTKPLDSASAITRRRPPSPLGVVGKRGGMASAAETMTPTDRSRRATVVSYHPATDRPLFPSSAALLVR
ncbi:hypothetical protein PVAP13_8NG253900 [Panicum virgatum]|uniref:Protein kinase domain-containing protein n=1 Tax=Panicum virgatum TaxID=38727 RepID=A0A8T0P5W3_PANVG|nr:hypothetical protein PVAP13_8NG253900 [Panicum virgatum]